MSLTPDTRSRDQLLEDCNDFAQACPKQARRVSELEAENARLQRLLDERDEFIAAKDLWSEFVALLEMRRKSHG